MPYNPTAALSTLSLLLLTASRLSSAYSHFPSSNIYARDAIAEAEAEADPEAYDNYDDFDFTDLLHRRYADALVTSDNDLFESLSAFSRRAALAEAEAYAEAYAEALAEADAEADPEAFAEPEPEPLFGKKKSATQLTGCCAPGSVINGRQRLICRGNPAWGGVGANGVSCDNLKGEF